jgi:two-component system, NarL family, sensor histidine kinase UhpB
MSELAPPLQGMASQAYAGKPMRTRIAELLQRLARQSLVTRIFLANAALFLAAYLVLALAPVTISAPSTAGQLLGLTIGLLILFVVDLIVVRRALSPLRRLTAFSAEVSSAHTGRRLPPDPWRSREAADLTRGFNTMLDRLEAERRARGKSVLTAQEAERDRVARALHDELGQTLTAMTLSAQRAAEGDEAQMRSALEEVADTAQSSLDEVRRIARELRPEALDDLGLVNALIALSRRIDEQSGVRVRHHFDHMPDLAEDVELAIYRIAQESLTNVIRHAGATKADVSLRADNGRVVLKVVDDGKGLTEVPGPDAAGIAGMRERAMLVGGTLSIGAATGGGTEVRLEVAVGEAG